MKNFTYKSKYGTYENCYFYGSQYQESGNIALEIWSNEEGPICRVTVHPGIKVPEDCIAIKNYSENEGVVDWMKSMGFIEDAPVRIIKTGWVEIPVYKMTDLLKSHLLGEVE